jgi:hypothetical protein
MLTNKINKKKYKIDKDKNFFNKKNIYKEIKKMKLFLNFLVLLILSINK